MTQQEPARIAKVCATCGSHAVCRDAAAIWDRDAQAWKLGGLMDSAYCEDCRDDDIRIIDKPEPTP